MTFAIGLLLFPGITQLDLTGPFEVLRRIPDSRVHLLWKTLDVVRADSGLGLVPDTTYAECPPLDMILVPGGPGQIPLMEDEPTLSLLSRAAASARFVTSVCTGALVLGAAGLLRGKRATTHWAYLDLLGALGAVVTRERVVVDGQFVTAGGVTAGIDFGLTIAAEVAGAEVAQEIALELEYDPAPRFSGDPARAPEELRRAVERRQEPRRQARRDVIDRVLAKRAPP